MDGTPTTSEEHDAALDRMIDHLSRSEHVRGFEIERHSGFAAMIDSDTDDLGGIYIWVGFWPKRPTAPTHPVIEVVAVPTHDALRARTGALAGPDSMGREAPRLRSANGTTAAMTPVTAHGYSAAWVGETDGAVVGVFTRSTLEAGTIISELADVDSVVSAWRKLV